MIIIHTCTIFPSSRIHCFYFTPLLHAAVVLQCDGCRHKGFTHWLSVGLLAAVLLVGIAATKIRYRQPKSSDYISSVQVSLGLL